jgi:hypothetical protein
VLGLWAVGQLAAWQPSLKAAKYRPPWQRERSDNDCHMGPEMFAYYLQLALRSFRRNPGITALMVFAIALGISVCMITLTTYRAASANPSGDRSSILFAPSLDSWDPNEAYDRDDKTLAPTCSPTAMRVQYTPRNSGSQGHHVQVRRHLQARGQRHGAAIFQDPAHHRGLLRDVRCAVSVWRSMGRQGRRWT